MPRTQGQMLERRWKQGRGYALRFRAYGERQYLTLGMQSEGWTRKSAQIELQNILADVRRGTWSRPIATSALGPRPRTDRTSRPSTSSPPPGTQNVAARSPRAATEARNGRSATTCCPTSPTGGSRRSTYPPSMTTVATRSNRASSGPPRSPPANLSAVRTAASESLSAATINKTINVLHAILELAVEYGHIASNPAAGRRRGLKLPAQRPVHLDAAEQIQALLDAAGELDCDARRPTCDRRAIIATLILAGPRAHELCNLCWRDVDLANGRIHVGRSKTQAGLREIPLLPLLRDELATHKAMNYRAGADDPVFPTGTGGHRDKDNLRNRILAPALVRADALLLQRGQTPLPAGVTPHKLRHTFSSILVALGWDPASVMAALGHADPRMTLRVYTHLMRRGSEERQRLAGVVGGEQSEARPPGEHIPA
jgi:integrase